VESALTFKLCIVLISQALADLLHEASPGFNEAFVDSQRTLIEGFCRTAGNVNAYDADIALLVRSTYVNFYETLHKAVSRAHGPAVADAKSADLGNMLCMNVFYDAPNSSVNLVLDRIIPMHADTLAAWTDARHAYELNLNTLH
jgi:hypothetical protein